MPRSSSSGSATSGSATASPLASLPGLPDGIPGGALGGGRAALRVGGVLEARIALRLVEPSVYAPPPGGFALTFAGRGGASFAVGGATFAGSRTSSSSLVVVTRLPGVRGLFVSSPGDCTVVIDRADANEVVGTVGCDEVVGSSGTIAIRGRFRARA